MWPQWIQWYDRLGSVRMLGYESAPFVHFMYISYYQGNLLYWTSSYASLFQRDLLFDVLVVYKLHTLTSQKTLIFTDIAYVYNINSMNIQLDYSACAWSHKNIFCVLQHSVLLKQCSVLIDVCLLAVLLVILTVIFMLMTVLHRNNKIL